MLISSADPFATEPTLGVEVAKTMGAPVELFDGSGHWWMMDNTAVATSVLERF